MKISFAIVGVLLLAACPGFMEPLVPFIADHQANRITSFSLGVPNEYVKIAADTITVNVTVPYRTPLIPAIIHMGTNIIPASGVEQDFINPVVYTVYSKTGATRQYTVKVFVIETFDVSNTAEMNDAVTAIANGGNYKSYEIRVTEDVGMTQAVNAHWGTADLFRNFRSADNIKVTITGGGSITYDSDSNGWLFIIGPGQHLILKDIEIIGKTGGQPVIGIIGELTMEAGSSVSGRTVNTTPPDCSAVYVRGGKFTMNGGEIVNNKNLNAGSTVGKGAGVCVLLGEFIMNDGIIAGNSTNRIGGGVYIGSGCTFTMTGGEIFGNSASSGGGVYVEAGGTFNNNYPAGIYGNSPDDVWP